MLLYYLGYSRIKNLILRLRRQPVSRFVTFHDLPSKTLGCFKANLHFLKQSTNVVSLADFFSGRLSSEKINVVITFDDGYKSWVSDAIPVLQELKLPATFFVSSGFVGLSREDEAEFIRSRLFLPLGPRRITGGLNFEDVRRIVEEAVMSEATIRLHIETLAEGGFLATSPDVPGLIAEGRSIQEATEIAQGLVRKIVESCLEHGDPLPPALAKAVPGGPIDITVPVGIR